MKIHPASRFCSSVLKNFPEAGRGADMLRATRKKKGGPQWPEWCFLPMSGATAIITHGRDLSRQPATFAEFGMLPLLSAALAWRPTQDIVRFDADVYEALKKTPPADDAPDLLFRQLPAWCVYIELRDENYHGVFVHLEYDLRDGPENGREELRLLFIPHDPADIPVPQVMHMGHGSIAEGLAQFLREAEKNLQHMAQASTLYETLKKSVEKNDLESSLRKFDDLTMTTISLVLYLCSAEPEWSPQEGGLSSPSFAQPKKVKNGWRLFPPDKPRIWNVGMETGIKIRAAKSAASAERKGPRPHIRRAHWHTYWTGRKVWKEGETPVPQIPRAKWLPPIPVALEEDEKPQVS